MLEGGPGLDRVDFSHEKIDRRRIITEEEEERSNDDESNKVHPVRIQQHTLSSHASSKKSSASEETLRLAS